MEFLRSFKNLSPRTRIGVGVAFIAWGAIGVYVSDSAEKKFGLEASEKDMEDLKSAMPKIMTVTRER